MLAILTGPRSRLIYAEFGEPLLPPEDREALLRWILADYERRRDEQWRCTPLEGSPIVRGLLSGASEPGFVAGALLALGWYGELASARVLARYIDDPQPLVRKAAMRGLGQIGSFRAIPLVERALDDPDRQVAREALIALAKFGREETLKRAITEAAREPDAAVIVEHATRRTRALAARDAPGFVEATLESPWYEDLCASTALITKQLALIPPDPARPLEIRIRAARVLGLGRGRRSARFLLVALTDPKTPLPLRIECAQALARFSLPGILDSLLPLLDVEELELQLAIIAAVGSTGSQRALLPLLDRWDAREKTIREPVRLAIRTLGRSAVAEAVLNGWTRPLEGESAIAAAVIEGDRWTLAEGRSWVLQRLARTEPASRVDAAAILGLIGEASDLPLLSRLAAHDPDEEVRWIAAAAARSLAGGDVTP